MRAHRKAQGSVSGMLLLLLFGENDAQASQWRIIQNGLNIVLEQRKEQRERERERQRREKKVIQKEENMFTDAEACKDMIITQSGEI